MVKLIAVDMDGTFLNTKKTYDVSRFKQIFKELKKREIKFVVASGNQYAQLASFFPEITEEITFIAENGMLIVDQGELIREKHFTEEVVLAVTRYLKETYPNIQMSVNGMKGAYVEHHMSAEFKQIIEFYCPEHHWVDNLLELNFENDNYIKFILEVTASETEAIAQGIQEKFPQEIHPLSSGHGNIDLILPNNHKANGLKVLSQRWQIDPAEMMAFGDGQNDLEMLKYVGHSYAMSNGPVFVKEAARYVAPSNDESGVLQVIEEYLSR